MKWNGYNPKKSSPNVWYTIYGYTSYIFASWVFSVLGIFLPTQDENLDMDSLFDSLYLLPQMVILTVKIFPFLYRKKEIEFLLRRFEEDDFVPKLPAHKAIVEGCTMECKRLSAFFIYSSTTSWLLWVTKPFYMKGVILPLEIYLPFAISTGNLVYYAVYFYMSLSKYNFIVGKFLQFLIQEIWET